MENEQYYTNKKLIPKKDIYFHLSPCQFNDIIDIFVLVIGSSRTLESTRRRSQEYNMEDRQQDTLPHFQELSTKKIILKMN